MIDPITKRDVGSGLTGAILAAGAMMEVGAAPIPAPEASSQPNSSDSGGVILEIRVWLRWHNRPLHPTGHEVVLLYLKMKANPRHSRK